MTRTHEAIVVGAGPAGLATSRALSRAQIEHCVLERGPGAGHTWANLYDSLVLHTGKHLSALPGMPFPRGTALFPTRQQFLDYLQRYAQTFRVGVEPNADVVRAECRDGVWHLQLGSGATWRSQALVVATGIVANPHVPVISGREAFSGRLTHSVSYRRPEGVSGSRILVVGAGNSAGEIAVELARSGARITLAVRSGAAVVPRDLFGIPIQYLSVLLSPLPRPFFDRVTRTVGALRGPRVLPPPQPTPCPRVPLIGLALAEAVRERTIALRGDLEALTVHGARFSGGVEEPFDEIILATGYRAAIGFLDGVIRVDRCGFAHRRDRVASSDQPHLCFVGHNYDARGGLYNIARDAPRAAREVMRARRAASQTSIGTPPARSGK